MINTYRYLRVVVFPFAMLLALASAGFSQGTRILMDEGDLIWSDEFEGTGAPDGLKWERLEYNRRNNDNGPDGWWSNEDSYLDGNGNLVIRVRKIDNRNSDSDSCDFSVGMVRSKGRFEQLYGKFEIRCMLPTQPGWWVAFWMMQGDVSSVGNGGVDGTEVDIVEGFGWTNRVQHAFHWDGYGDEHQSMGHTVVPVGIRTGFHTFSMEWYPEMYVFYIDGEETWRSEGGGVCNQPGYIKVTGEISTEEWAINSYWANHPSKATYPDSFVVDYVRVYELGEYQYPAAVETGHPSERLMLFPNPVKDRLTVQWDGDLLQGLPELSITNCAGQVVRSFQPLQTTTHVYMDDLAGGVYFLSFNHGGSVERRMVIKE
jgi:beta-glucanase (GH16 family)